MVFFHNGIIGLSNEVSLLNGLGRGNRKQRDSVTLQTYLRAPPELIERLAMGIHRDLRSRFDATWRCLSRPSVTAMGKPKVPNTTAPSDWNCNQQGAAKASKDGSKVADGIDLGIPYTDLHGRCDHDSYLAIQRVGRVS